MPEPASHGSRASGHVPSFLAGLILGISTVSWLVQIQDAGASPSRPQTLGQAIDALDCLHLLPVIRTAQFPPGTPAWERLEWHAAWSPPGGYRYKTMVELPAARNGLGEGLLEAGVYVREE